MNHLRTEDVSQYVEENIGDFHERRIIGLSKLELKVVLAKKNPYLFKAKYLLTAHDIVKGLTDAFISSQEEGIFGNWLEGLALFVNSKAYGGWKSGISGIDLEFDNEGTRYIVAIKSGPNWANSSQIKKMITDFVTARKTLRTSNSSLNVIGINGCCYGRDNKPDKGDYFKYCGERFWKFISGDDDLFVRIIEPLGYKARERNDEFSEQYAHAINRFTKNFSEAFCLSNGAVDWEKFVRFNSGESKKNLGTKSLI